jgi:hypothetical protein
MGPLAITLLRLAGCATFAVLQASARRVIEALSLDQPLEFELAGPKAMCCGAGGARMWLEETIGQRINVLRAEQALGRESGVQQLDIAELVAAALPPLAGDAAATAGRGAQPAGSTVAARFFARSIAALNSACCGVPGCINASSFSQYVAASLKSRRS